MIATDGRAAAERARAVMLEEGFGLCGVCVAEPSERGDEMAAWLAAGKHGEMGYLAEHMDKRLDVRRLIEEAEGGPARSVIVVADAYEAGPAGDGKAAAGRGRVARYARGDDYHRVMKKRLHAGADRLRAMFPGAVFKACVDTAPVMEREHAARAGLGWIGKHTLLIHPRHGSYLFLGVLVTTLALEPTGPDGAAPAAVEPDRCGTCTRCLDACPTACITPYSVDASRCISYLTIEHRTAIAEELQPLMGDWLAGCDVCQEVCPWNGFDESAGEAPGYRVPLAVRPAYRPRTATLEAEAVAGWGEGDRRAAVRGSALKRIKLPMWRRNAEIAAGNQSDAAG
ncbi:MAG: tRNA epoxyqueuosine(34) reductase QueG [Planctomycetota bacterium]